MVTVSVSYFLVLGIHSSINKGQWDSYLTSGPVYDTIDDALLLAEENVITPTLNGIVYKRDVGNYTVKYVVQDTWLYEQGLPMNSDGLRQFIKTNGTMQILRTLVISGNSLLIFYVFPLLLILGYFSMPFLLILTTRIYTGGRVLVEDDDERAYMLRVHRITTGRLLDKILSRYDESNHVYLVTVIYSILVAGLTQDMIGNYSNLFKLIGVYLLVCVVLASYYFSAEYRGINKVQYTQYTKEQENKQQGEI